MRNILSGQQIWTPGAADLHSLIQIPDFWLGSLSGISICSVWACRWRIARCICQSGQTPFEPSKMTWHYLWWLLFWAYSARFRCFGEAHGPCLLCNDSLYILPALLRRHEPCNEVDPRCVCTDPCWRDCPDTQWLEMSPYDLGGKSWGSKRFSFRHLLAPLASRSSFFYLHAAIRRWLSYAHNSPLAEQAVKQFDRRITMERHQA